MAKVVGCLCFQVMEQVDGGDLVLNKGEEEKPRERSEDEPERDLQAVEGMTEGYKLALVSHIFLFPLGSAQTCGHTSFSNRPIISLTRLPPICILVSQ